MQPGTGGGRPRARPGGIVVVLGFLGVLALAGCVEVPVSNPTTSSVPELSALEELAAMPQLPVTEVQAGDVETAAFLTEGRNSYCTITTEQGGIISSPVDPRLSGGERDDTVLEVPAVYCELVRYPEPSEVTDDCHGTNLGFKGGTVLLTSEGATYGGCRIGMTLMEAELGPASDGSDSPVTRLPVLRNGEAVELNGFRCGRATDGVVCIHSETGHGFLVSAAGYEIYAPEEAAKP